ncbi:DUF3604 domain-containing protein [Chelatococcus asaccharovorans]|uniref:DUF3604 domain-containing protein n=1 Tax=Chelatococcus asaccharovorans TaxID=28210 RepID=UPI00224C68EF|nr:DUF3604 domain-containing protein [Chelatococcus asaccharovorans]CAH1661029.1 conserved exported hypothetical protein [Chelatococcus asaccharovorans]CAH1690074.1 conserved exported hypothetical protein [Chelatococcus asaccharovorans]
MSKSLLAKASPFARLSGIAPAACAAIPLLGLLSVPAAAQGTPERNAYFGETHVHTSWSFDAYIFGNHITGPADAYKYAKGEPIKHPLGYDVKITTPLDWMGVTDHSEYAGVVRLSNDPSSPISKLPIAEKLKVRDAADIQRIYFWLGTSMIKMQPIDALVKPEISDTVWKANNAAADAANEPGKFTAFCSYEWTSNPDFRNMHRNIFFRDCAKVPSRPFSSLESQAPEDLWNWMDGQRKAGNELLAISHNANLSGGLMYPTELDFKGRPIDQAWAESRDRNERLTEIKQIKGASETHPLLSPNDEFANYEILNYLLGDPQGQFITLGGSYVRQALKDGVAMQQARGYNPFKTGVVGGADSHNTAVPYRQENFFGGHARLDGTIKERMAGHNFAGLDVRLENPAGLTGVWAEENTRASLFDAMKRKETFATSGPRITLRFFGGWDYAKDQKAEQGHPLLWGVLPDWLKDRYWVKTAYAQGVPMGGDLAPPAAGKTAPSFAVWAVKDPTSGNLDRIQIVKGWSKNGQSFEKVFDVVWSGDRKPAPVTGKVPAIGSTVDIAQASYQNTIGATELKAVWSDPEFDPADDAFYYARVLEIPTPRWTTIQAKELGISPPEMVAATVQERAWSSPIWYAPTAEQRQAAQAGTTEADLKDQGAVPLNEAALQDLLVGKFTWIRNTVTGSVFKVQWSKEGQMLTMNVDPRFPQPSEVGDVTSDSYLGASHGYAISGGKIVTSFGNREYDFTVYKLAGGSSDLMTKGDTYLAARSNEFGYANYEIVPTPLFLGTEVKDPTVPQ